MSVLHETQKRIETREELIAFVELLRHDLALNGGQRENATLESYLEAVQAVLTDWTGRFVNRGEPVAETPSWRLVGEVLLAASVYE